MSDLRPPHGVLLPLCHMYSPVQVFSTVDPCLSVQWSGKDGDHVKSGTTFGTVKGSARSILVAERLALNFMQRMSGIATATAAMTDRMEASCFSLPVCLEHVLVTMTGQCS